MKEIVPEEHYKMAGELKENLSTYEESEDLINVGAYVKGSNPRIDRAMTLKLPIDGFLRQNVNEQFVYEETVVLLKELIKGKS